MNAREPLEELDGDVAEDGVADHDVRGVMDQVLALHVPREVEVGRIEKLGRPLDAGVALALLLADREERDAGPLDAEGALGEQGAHVGVLGEVLRGRVGVRPDVEEHERSRVGDHLDREGGAIHAAGAAQAQDRGRHRGAGVPGGDHGVGPTALHEVAGDEDGGVLLLAEREGRVLVHLDDLAGGLDGHVGREGGSDDGGDPRRHPDEDYLVVGVLRSVQERPGHDLVRGVVTAHRVDRQADPAAVLDAPNGREVHGGRRLAAAARAAVRRPPRRPSS